MVSTTVAAIIAAVCAAAGAIIAALITKGYATKLLILVWDCIGWGSVISQQFDYSFLRACNELQTVLWELYEGPSPLNVDMECSNGVLHSHDYFYILFLFGQYFALSLALESEALHYTPFYLPHYTRRHTAHYPSHYTPRLFFSRRDRFRYALSIVHAIRKELDSSADKSSFRIHRGIQEAIGGIMTKMEKDSELGVCIGYADFVGKWVHRSSNPTDEYAFPAFFSQLEDALKKFWSLKSVISSSGSSSSSNSAEISSQYSGMLKHIVCFQHLLISLIETLDPDEVQLFNDKRHRVPNPNNEFKCPCRKCPCPPSNNPDIREDMGTV